MEYHKTRRLNELKQYTVKYMNLKNTILSLKSQLQESTYLLFNLHKIQK